MWLSLLEYANKGVSLNLLVTRIPTNLLFADSCPSGMGGFSAHSGIAWRLPLDPTISSSAFELDPDPSFTTLAVSTTNPDHSVTATTSPDRPDRTTATEPWSNNLFEFMAIVVSLWVDCWYGHIHPDSSALCLSDNSSAVGWMHKASFGLNKPRHAAISKKLTELTLSHRFALQTEHIPGNSNTVADLLSRRFDLTDSELTRLIHRQFPTQIPKTFHIKQLPNDILCWICSMVPRLLEFSMARQKELTNSATSADTDGRITWSPLDSPTTPSWKPSNPPTTAPPSPSDSCRASEMQISPKSAPARTLFEQALLRKPLETWLQPSGITIGQAPAMAKTVFPSTPSKGPFKRAWSHLNLPKMRTSHHDKTPGIPVEAQLPA